MTLNADSSSSAVMMPKQTVSNLMFSFMTAPICASLDVPGWDPGLPGGQGSRSPATAPPGTRLAWARWNQDVPGRDPSEFNSPLAHVTSIT
jgi:hypothetical protein